jgi:hypothetical protein
VLCCGVLWCAVVCCAVTHGPQVRKITLHDVRRMGEHASSVSGRAWKQSSSSNVPCALVWRSTYLQRARGAAAVAVIWLSADSRGHAARSGPHARTIPANRV